MGFEMHQFIVPPLTNNSYLVWDGASGKGMLIDPAMGADDILFYVRPRRIQILYILNTHGHYDHVWENAKLKKATQAKLCIGKGDEKLLPDAVKLMPPHLRLPYELSTPDLLLKEGDKLQFGKEELSVLHTPGHTPGSICLHHAANKILFTGDTLFARTYGRTDLPHSDPKLMEKSLARLARLPPETTVFPGHGVHTTIGIEGWLNKYRKK